MCCLTVLIGGLVAGCSRPAAPTAAAPTATIAAPPTVVPTSTPRPTVAPTAAPTAAATATPGEPLDKVLARATSIESLKYDLVMTQPGQEPSVGRVWLKGDKVRVESGVAGQDGSFTIQDLGSRTRYDYSATQNRVVRLDLMPWDALSFPYSGKEVPGWFTTAASKVVGAETLDGKACVVVTGNAGDITFRAWIWKDRGFPIRMDVRAAGDFRLDWRNMDFGPLSDALFVPPSGTGLEGWVNIESIAATYAGKDSAGNHQFALQVSGSVRGPERAYLNLFVPPPWLMSPSPAPTMPALTEDVQWLPVASVQWTPFENGRYVRREAWAAESSNWTASGTIKIPDGDFVGQKTARVEVTAWLSAPPKGLLASQVWWRAFALPDATPSASNPGK